MDVNTDRAHRRTIAVPILVLTLLLVPSMAIIPLNAGSGSKTLDWSPEGQVTDPNDYFTDNIGKLMGYIDKGTATAVYHGRMYVAWETSERKKGGTMIYVRSLKGTVWNPIEAVAGVEDGIVDTEPALAVAGDSLYLAWQHAGSDDTDVMCRALTDDVWSDCGYISPQGNFGMDDAPSLTSFNGDIYAAWVTHSVVTGKDNDGDIALRRYTGVDWESPPMIVNRIPANGYDAQPKLAVYRDKLVVTWVTRDSKVTNGTDMDIVFREYDGSNWGQFHEVTLPDGVYDDDTYPSVAVYLDKLYISWETPGGKIGDADIAVATWDGQQVGGRWTLNPPHNLAADEHPFAKAFGDRLFVVWNSNDPNYTSDGDDDIAIAYYDGTQWSAPEEATPNDMEDGRAAIDRYPVLESFDGGLYAIWESDDQRPSNHVTDASDLMYRRHPPEKPKLDYLVVGLIILTVVLAMAFVAYWAFGQQKRTSREKRYLKRKERERLKIGPDEFIIRKRGGRKGRGRKRKKKFS